VWWGVSGGNKFLFISFSIYIHQPTQMMMRDIGVTATFLAKAMLLLIIGFSLPSNLWK
jgi:hypothetical protein